MPVSLLDQSEQAIRTAVEVNLCRGADRMPAGAAEMVGPPQRAHRQHRVTGRRGAGTRAGGVRRNEVRRGGNVDGDGRRARPTRRACQRGHATVHRHRPDRGHPDAVGQQTGGARGSPPPWSKVLEKPKTHVGAGHPMRFMAPLMSMLDPRGRWLNARVGSDRLPGLRRRRPAGVPATGRDGYGMLAPADTE